MKKILVSWSIAFDYIMDYQDSFKNNILPDQIHVLNVSFYINQLKKEKGWTWSNIAYNLWLLNEHPILLWAVWTDFDIDKDLHNNCIKDYLIRSNDKLTACAHIITDQDNNQITAFYPWAMEDSDQKNLTQINEEISYIMISPNKKETMLKYIIEWKKLWIKTFFDPGQQLSVMKLEDLEIAMQNATYLILNEYELELFCQKTSLSKNEIVNKFEKVIVTLWKQWVDIIDKNNIIQVNAIPTENVLDPTWAGDAFRGGLLKWLNSGYDWETSVQIGNVTAHYCIQKYWTQNHKFTVQEFKEKFENHYKKALNM